jgi:hypothetical protein
VGTLQGWIRAHFPGLRLGGGNPCAGRLKCPPMERCYFGFVAHCAFQIVASPQETDGAALNFLYNFRSQSVFTLARRIVAMLFVRALVVVSLVAGGLSRSLPKKLQGRQTTEPTPETICGDIVTAVDQGELSPRKATEATVDEGKKRAYGRLIAGTPSNALFLAQSDTNT